VHIDWGERSDKTAGLPFWPHVLSVIASHTFCVWCGNPAF